MSTVTIAAITIAVIAIAVAMWAILRMRNTKRLRSKFGPEYDHLVEREGGRGRAETELTHREKRVDKLNIRSLTAPESDRFAAAWRQQQSRFVDDPRGAVSEADALITEVMTARGYPTANFQTQVADISVDHARVATNYREAHEIAERSRQDKSSTEELRRAMICYRALFEDLVDAKVVKLEPEEVKR
jgi:hypothetical protein